MPGEKAQAQAGQTVGNNIRLADGTVAGDDQSRVATPGRTVAAGADYLVIGRPITRAEDPREAASQIAEAIRRGE